MVIPDFDVAWRRTASAPVDRVMFLGLDLGQRESNTAIVLLDRFSELPEFTDVLRGTGMRRRYVVRQAERVALGTTYPAVVTRVKRIVEWLSVRGQCVDTPCRTALAREVASSILDRIVHRAEREVAPRPRRLGLELEVSEGLPEIHPNNPRTTRGVR